MAKTSSFKDENMGSIPITYYPIKNHTASILSFRKVIDIIKVENKRKNKAITR